MPARTCNTYVHLQRGIHLSAQTPPIWLGIDHSALVFLFIRGTELLKMKVGPAGVVSCVTYRVGARDIVPTYIYTYIICTYIHTPYIVCVYQNLTVISPRLPVRNDRLSFFCFLQPAGWVIATPNLLILVSEVCNSSVVHSSLLFLVGANRFFYVYVTAVCMYM